MFPAEELGRDQLTISPDGRGFVNVSGKDDTLSQYYTNMIPLQYIGIKDRDGDEIYHMDILEIELDGITYRSSVMKRHACWVIHHPYRINPATEEKDYINFGWWVSHSNVKIIGSMHENPELLEVHT